MMITTAFLSWPTAYFLQLPSLPLGPPPARPLLFIRGIAGAIGIWGFYYSLRSLALSEASIINFLSPTLAALLLSLLPSSSTSSSGISLAQLAAGGISMGGAVCVLQPWITQPEVGGGHRALAILAAVVGVAGGAVSYVAMARLGDSVHPAHTLAYFSTTTAVLSALLILVQWQPLHLPSAPMQWGLTLLLGVLGFAMHWLMTASLAQADDAKRPLNFVYTQMVFAMVADRVVWGVGFDVWKYLGGALIIASAVFVASTAEKMSHQYALVDGQGAAEEDEVELEMGKERADVAVAKDVEP
ncbi:uncharacterized protein CC84DRAFT_1171148 [Paraphaeosphaeria sporulosa]|uniref:EamA domain-containing protein n=1 Tax=Paraphaeosphaeria sporulosa TaxID=1460663 RepID=A0A177CXW6_9PLEO|nr:uncharacterized protein CC84DRAFT_1171148 [Paraphaeosphaeria sporulosa]OAG12414.1 hypothetical protein CC84DRAFT_1171148 [Paraphaeosphaeria sporulosa]